MWRSLVQRKCEHGSWNSEFGIWDGVPSDPWWFKSELNDIEFLQEAHSAGLQVHQISGNYEHFPTDVDLKEDGYWFEIGSQLLLAYKFTDPTNQLRRMASELYSFATHHKLCLKHLRVVMYQSPIKKA